MGGSSAGQVGQANTASPEQSNFINQILGQLTGQGAGAYGDILDPGDFDDLFQKAYVDPAMQTFEQQTIPAIQSSFGAANAGSSSALNQALASSAKDLSVSLGSQAGEFYQNQQNRKLEALGQMGNLSGTSILDPIIQEGYDPTGGYIEGGSKILAAIVTAAAAAFAASSKNYKENIRDYGDALDKVNSLEVKQYDYKEEFGGGKGCVGLIAEDVPEELCVSQNGFVGVDVYGLCSMLVKAVQNLSEKVEKMEALNADTR